MSVEPSGILASDDRSRALDGAPAWAEADTDPSLCDDDEPQAPGRVDGLTFVSVRRWTHSPYRTDGHATAKELSTTYRLPPATIRAVMAAHGVPFVDTGDRRTSGYLTSALTDAVTNALVAKAGEIRQLGDPSRQGSVFVSEPKDPHNPFWHPPAAPFEVLGIDPETDEVLWRDRNPMPAPDPTAKEESRGKAIVAAETAKFGLWRLRAAEWCPRRPVPVAPPLDLPPMSTPTVEPVRRNSPGPYTIQNWAHDRTDLGPPKSAELRLLCTEQAAQWRHTDGLGPLADVPPPPMSGSDERAWIGCGGRAFMKSTANVIFNPRILVIDHRGRDSVADLGFVCPPNVRAACA